MPLNTSKSDGNWLVDINAVDRNGKQIYTPDGKPLKTKVQMEDATFADGTKQPLYFPPGHLKEGLFKGMKVILEERGITLPAGKKRECTGFKCPDKGRTDCCYCRVLYNQQDFTTVESLLETYCKSRRVEVIFLLKFHCELNFIEQCWGYAKRIYRHYPASSKEADLEHNMLASLESVPLSSMKKLVN